MRLRSVLVSVGVIAVAAGVTGVALSQSDSPAAGDTVTPTAVVKPDTGLPAGVTLQQIAGGPNYYGKVSTGSAWMDRHILLGAWDEQPLTLQDVKMDVKMGNNIYWNLVGNPLVNGCGGPCRANFNVIRAGGMHASAPDTTAQSGWETVAYEGSDEADMQYGPGSNAWNPKVTIPNEAACVPVNTACGYTVANFFYTGKPTSDGPAGYPAGKKAITQGYGKGILFWETNAQAEQFLKYSDTLSADSYWMTDPALKVASQGACAIMPKTSTECLKTGLSTAQSALPANYAWNVIRFEQLEQPLHMSKPIVVDVETGCPGSNNECVTPAISRAAAWHALIAGARGIIWFQHNFGGKCIDFRTFYDGSYPNSKLYNCQQTPGVTLHDVVENISAFNHEVGSLNSVLLSPFAEHYVSVGKSDVAVMAKHANGKFYVFAASGNVAKPPTNDMKVTFHLAGAYTGPVTVIDEHRTLYAVHGVFTDTFLNAESVHVYEIK